MEKEHTREDTEGDSKNEFRKKHQCGMSDFSKQCPHSMSEFSKKYQYSKSESSKKYQHRGERGQGWL